MLDKQVQENKRSIEDAERWKKEHDKSMDISAHESTVILLHEGEHRAKMTVPIGVTGSFIRNTHKRMGYLLFPLKAVLLLGLLVLVESFVDDTVYTSAKTKGCF